MKKLGFGMMRLPKKGDAYDMEQVKEMVDLFLETEFEGGRHQRRIDKITAIENEQ